MTPATETDLFQTAIDYWWKSKKLSTKKKSQGGARDSNLHGRTMDGFALLLTEFLVGLGVNPAHVFSGRHLGIKPSILPSYFRASKNWDLIVVANSRHHPAAGDEGEPILYAAVEFKSQEKSIGNNQNNRLEESIGNATDFWTTYEHQGYLRQQPRPWLGYLFVGRHQPDDRKTVKIKQPHFEAAPPFRVYGSSSEREFDGPSYEERYLIFLKQCVGARLYDAGAFIVTDESIAKQSPNHRILLPEFGSANFLRSLKAQILAHYPSAEVKAGSLASKV